MEENSSNYKLYLWLDIITWSNLCGEYNLHARNNNAYVTSSFVTKSYGYVKVG
jgi:hypothetical protein